MGRPPDASALDSLIGRAAVGVRLIGGWKVVIAGRPNVGKSRLFNALAGYERSIVNARPGVTRDVVSLRTAFGGWPVELCDTAGERAAEDAVERLGIARSQAERRDADLILVVLDRSEPLQAVDRELLGTESAGPRRGQQVRPPRRLGCRAGEPAARRDPHRFGRDRRGTRCPGLQRSLLTWCPSLRHPGAAVPFREDHRQGLIRAPPLSRRG